MAAPWIAATTAEIPAKKWLVALVAPPGEGEVGWWTGSAIGAANILGWWDGDSIEDVALLGWWDGDSIVPL